MAIGSAGAGAAVVSPFAVHLLDQGLNEYGDAILCQFGSTTVLIDGAHPGDQNGSPGHPSIPRQIAQILNQQPPFQVDLLIVSHAHEDHIGCLPHLVKNNLLRARWALVADPQLGWGRPRNGDSGGPPDSGPLDARVQQLVAAMREPIRSPKTDPDALADFMVDAVLLEDRYADMLDRLEASGTKVVRFIGAEPAAGLEPTDLIQEFEHVGLKILGPTPGQVALCADRIAASLLDATEIASELVGGQDAAVDVVDLYRRIAPSSDSLDAASRLGAAVNLQSIVIRF